MTKYKPKAILLPYSRQKHNAVAAASTAEPHTDTACSRLLSTLPEIRALILDAIFTDTLVHVTRFQFTPTEPIKDARQWFNRNAGRHHQPPRRGDLHFELAPCEEIWYPDGLQTLSPVDQIKALVGFDPVGKPVTCSADRRHLVYGRCKGRRVEMRLLSVLRTCRQLYYKGLVALLRRAFVEFDRWQNSDWRGLYLFQRACRRKLLLGCPRSIDPPVFRLRKVVLGMVVEDLEQWRRKLGQMYAAGLRLELLVVRLPQLGYGEAMWQGTIRPDWEPQEKRAVEVVKVALGRGLSACISLRFEAAWRGQGSNVWIGWKKGQGVTVLEVSEEEFK